MNRQNFDEESNMNSRNNNINFNNQSNQNNQQGEPDNNPNFFQNPQEAIAKELMNRAEEKLTKGWLDKFKCNFE
jgi:hypothetical protein